MIKEENRRNTYKNQPRRFSRDFGLLFTGLAAGFFWSEIYIWPLFCFIGLLLLFFAIFPGDGSKPRIVVGTAGILAAALLSLFLMWWDGVFDETVIDAVFGAVTRRESWVIVGVVSIMIVLGGILYIWGRRLGEKRARTMKSYVQPQVGMEHPVSFFGLFMIVMAIAILLDFFGLGWR